MMIPTLMVMTSLLTPMQLHSRYGIISVTAFLLLLQNEVAITHEC